MFNNLCADPKYKQLDISTVQKVYVLTGSNNADNIYFGKQSLQQGYHGITSLINHWKDHFAYAKINIINILPRKTKGINHVIKELNAHIRSLCLGSPGQLKYVDTESEHHLFSDLNGVRKNIYFSLGIYNVHLNRAQGVPRFAKHLKYLAHY